MMILIQMMMIRKCHRCSDNGDGSGGPRYATSSSSKHRPSSSCNAATIDATGSVVVDVDDDSHDCCSGDDQSWIYRIGLLDLERMTHD